MLSIALILDLSLSPFLPLSSGIKANKLEANLPHDEKSWAQNGWTYTLSVLSNKPSKVEDSKGTMKPIIRRAAQKWSLTKNAGMHQMVIIVSWCRKIVRNWYRGPCIINQAGHQNPLKPESIIHATSPAGRRGSWTRWSSLGFWAGGRKHTEFLLQLVRPASGARSAWPIVRANKHFVILFAITAFKFVDRHLMIFCVFSFPSTPCLE